MKCIDAFLCFRQQRVVVNGVKSDWAPRCVRFPQGTVLGPLLLYPPQTVFVGGILFSGCLSVRPSESPTVCP